MIHYDENQLTSLAVIRALRMNIQLPFFSSDVYSEMFNIQNFKKFSSIFTYKLAVYFIVITSIEENNLLYRPLINIAYRNCTNLDVRMKNETQSTQSTQSKQSTLLWELFAGIFSIQNVGTTNDL